MNADSAAIGHRRPGDAKGRTPVGQARGRGQYATTTRPDYTLPRTLRRRPIAPPSGVCIVYAALALSLVILPRLSGPTGASSDVTIVRLPAPVLAPTPNPQPATTPTPTPMPFLQLAIPPVIQSRSVSVPTLAARATDSGIVEATCAGVRLAPWQNYERASATSCGAR